MVNKIKSVAIILLLLFLTTVIVFMPYFISKDIDSQRLSNTSRWNYSAQNAVKITDKDVALLYYNGKIDADVYKNFERPVFGENEGINDTNYSIKKEINALFDKVFVNNETIGSCMKEMFENSNICFSQTEVLTMIDERPVVLNVICVIAEAVHGTMEIIYEQKSNTMIGFNYYSVFPLDETNSIKSNELVEAVSQYYTSWLELNNRQFFAHYEIIEKADFKNYFAWFGISNFKNEIYYEKEEDGVIVLPYK